MNRQPPAVVGYSEYAAAKDRDHLRILSVLHLVTAGLALFSLLFLIGHYMVMSRLMDPSNWQSVEGGNPPPDYVVDIMMWFYLFGGLMIVGAIVLNLMSALFMRNKTHRMFSIIVAGINCIQVPVGTVLGVFTLVVLLRESVKKMYDNKQQP